MARRTLVGKRAIITGASSGIGRELALQLAQAGVQVCLTARRQDRLQQVRQAIEAAQGVCEMVAGDITQPEVQIALIERTVERFGGVDLLINNAGVTALGRFDEADSERLRAVFEVNFFAAAELIRHSIPLLERGSEPLIVNIGSVLGHRAVPLKSEYCASKFALHGFSDAIRCELASRGIDVLLVSPSTTDSELFDVAVEDTTGRSWKGAGAMPAQRVAKLAIRAIKTRKHEIVLTGGGRALVWLDRLFPTLSDRLITRFCAK